MHATILSSAALPLPSASGIEIVGELAYVISDDAPYLYTFRAADLTPGKPLQLFETAHFSTGRIPKDKKLDLEGMTLIPPTKEGERPALLLIGSGATSEREKGFWVELEPNGPGPVYPLDLGPLYRRFRRLLPTGTVLNLESVATTPDALLFFQRPVGTTRGRLGFRLPLQEAVAELRWHAPASAPIQPFPYALPDISGHAAGLSGAAWLDERLLITASAEATSDPVADGEVMGSLIGCLDLYRPARSQFAVLAWPDGRPFREKVEGLAVRAHRPDGSYELLLVTDDDAGGSTVLVCRADPR